MLKLGLKCSCNPEQLSNRLQYKPDIIELHLNEDDLFKDKRRQLENTISRLLNEGIAVYLHHPSKYNGRFLDIIHEKKEDYRANGRKAFESVWLLADQIRYSAG